jgi:hypothetical protein
MKLISEPDIDPEQWRCRNCGLAFDVPRGKRSDRFSKHRDRKCTHQESGSRAAH